MEEERTKSKRSSTSSWSRVRWRSTASDGAKRGRAEARRTNCGPKIIERGCAGLKARLHGSRNRNACLRYSQQLPRATNQSRIPPRARRRRRRRAKIAVQDELTRAIARSPRPPEPNEPISPRNHMSDLYECLLRARSLQLVTNAFISPPLARP